MRHKQTYTCRNHLSVINIRWAIKMVNGEPAMGRPKSKRSVRPVPIPEEYRRMLFICLTMQTVMTPLFIMHIDMVLPRKKHLKCNNRKSKNRSRPAQKMIHQNRREKCRKALSYNHRRENPRL